MERQIASDPEDLLRLFRTLEIDPKDVEKFHSGRYADLFRSGDVVAKIFHTRVQVAQNEFSALRWLDGLPVPKVGVFARSRSLCGFTCEFIDGEVCDRFFEFGVAIAQVHERSWGTGCEVRYTSDPLPLDERLIVNAEKYGASSDDISWLVLAVEQMPQERVLIHRDLVPRNVMAYGDGVCIVDWEDAAYAPSAWDFVKIRRWSPKLVDEIEAGYRTVRPIPSDESIEIFKRYESMVDHAR